MSTTSPDAALPTGATDAEPDGPKLAPGDGATRVRSPLGRHRVFAALAVVGLALRTVVVLAYRPAVEYLGDSGAYLDQAWHTLYAGDWRPSGYPMFLRLIHGQQHLTLLVVVQQLLTFAAAVGLYAAAVRVTRRPALAALVAAPALLYPWVVDLGQFVLADSLFGSLVLIGLVALAGPGRPGWPACALAGAVLGAAVTVRTAGYGPLAVALVVLLAAVRTVGARRIVVFVLAAAAPLAAYSGWSASDGYGFTVTQHSGFFLYGRVAPFADCSVVTRPDLAELCDPRPISQRPQPDAYLWRPQSPLRQGTPAIPPGREKLAGQFAGQVIRQQPGLLIATTFDYLAGYFSPVRHQNAKTSRANTWELPRTYTNALPDDQPHAVDGYYVATSVTGSLARPLAAYSRAAYPTMPLVGLGLLAGLAAAARAMWTRRRRSPAGRRPGPPRLFWLTGGAALSVLTIGALTAGFDYRYLAAVIGPVGAAAVLGFAALLAPRVPPAPAGPAGPAADDVSSASAG